MSASHEKKKRIEEKASGVADKRLEKTNAENKENKKVRKMAIIVVAVVVVLFAAAMIINSPALRRNTTAVTIGNTDYSITDFNYYYSDVYSQYYANIKTNFSDYASTMLPSSDKPFASQIYDEETGETWADFFDEMTLGTMRDDTAKYEAAVAAGYELPQEEVDEIETSISNLKDQIELYGTYKNLDAYYKAVYGNGMNEKAYRSILYKRSLATSYGSYINNSFTYTSDELEANYTEHAGTMDYFTYRYFLISPEAIDETEFETEEEITAAEELAALEAQEQAESIAKSIKSEADFIAAAKKYDSETYELEDSTLRTYKGDLLGSTYGDWLRDEARKEGDVGTASMNAGTYVVYFKSRSNNHYNTVNARCITLVPETVSSEDYENGTSDEEYIAARKEAHDTAVENANDLVLEWADNGATEDGFIEMFDNYSKDTTYEGGLYQGIYQSLFCDDATEWLYDSSRKEGDYTVIDDTDTIYIFYFVGEGRQFSDILSETSLRDEDYDAWLEEIGSPEYVKRFGFRFAL